MSIIIRGSGGKLLKYNDFVNDATASVSDVKSGKIFYNNNGRQIGSGEFLEEKTIILTAGQYSSTYNNVKCFYVDKNDGTINSISTTYTHCHGKKVQLENAKMIIGITYNGLFTPIINYFRTTLERFSLYCDTKKTLFFTTQISSGIPTFEYVNSYQDYITTIDFTLHYI